MLLAEPLFRPRIRISKSASKGWGPLYPRPTLDTFGTLEGFWGGEIAALVYGNMTQSGFLPGGDLNLLLLQGSVADGAS